MRKSEQSHIIGGLKEFCMDWWPLALLMAGYFAIPRIGGVIQSILGISINKAGLIAIDRLCFGDPIPVVAFQAYAGNPVLDWLAILVYMSHFILPFIIGVAIWLERKKDKRALFIKMRTAFIILVVAGLFTYLIFPAYPPWYAAKEGLLPPMITPWKDHEVGKALFGFSVEAGRNDFAPVPSLHTAWAVLFAFIIYTRLKQSRPVLARCAFLYPVLMMFVITYTADHYVIDIIAGVIYAAVALWLVFKQEKQKHSDPKTRSK